MRWGLILILSVVGVLTAIGTIYGLFEGVDWLVGPLTWILFGIAVGMFARGKYFLHGFLTGVIATVFSQALTRIFFDTLVAHSPSLREAIERAREGTLLGPMALVSAVFGIALAGAAAGVLALFVGVIKDSTRRTRPLAEIAAGEGLTPTTQYDFSSLGPYYDEEFKKFHESNGSYKGKWNWAAFFFGPIWGLTKGLWLAPLIATVVGVLTVGLVGLIYAFIFGSRGNLMYYTMYMKNVQLAR